MTNKLSQSKAPNIPSPNYDLLEFARMLKFKDLNITDRPASTLNTYSPIISAYNDYAKVIKTVYGLKISMTELANEALIRHLKDVLEQNEMYFKAKKLYEKKIKEDNDILQ